MSPHQEQLLRIAVVMFICLFGMLHTMFNVRRLHRIFHEQIMYEPTPARKLAVLAFAGGVLFCAGAMVVTAR